LPKPKKKEPTSPKNRADADFKEAEEALNKKLAEEAKPEGGEKEPASKPHDEVEEKTKDEKSEDVTPEPLDFGQEYERLARKKGFKTPEDLATAYINLESRTSRVENMARDALKRLEPNEGSKVAPKTPTQDEALEILDERIKNAIREEMAPLRREREKSVVEEEISTIQEKYPDFKGQVVADAIRWAAQRPGTNLEEAYKALTFDIARNAAMATLKKEEKKKEKKSAYAEGAASANSSRDIDYESMTLEELEEVLPKAGPFVDSKGVLRKV